MQTYPKQETATIHQFPVGGRAGLTASRHDSRRSDDTKSTDRNEYAVTDAWYHQDAIRDAQATKQ